MINGLFDRLRVFGSQSGSILSGSLLYVWYVFGCYVYFIADKMIARNECKVWTVFEESLVRLKSLFEWKKF